MNDKLHGYSCLVVLMVLSSISCLNAKPNDPFKIFYEKDEIPKLHSSRIDELSKIVSNRAGSSDEVYAVWVYRNDDNIFLDILYLPVKIEANLFAGMRSVVHNRRRSEIVIKQGYLTEKRYQKYWLITDEDLMGSTRGYYPFQIYELKDDLCVSDKRNYYEYCPDESLIKPKDVVDVYNFTKCLLAQAKNSMAVNNSIRNKNDLRTGAEFNTGNAIAMLRERLLRAESKINSRFHDAFILRIDIESPTVVQVRIGYTGDYRGNVVLSFNKQDNRWIADKIPSWFTIPGNSVSGKPTESEVKSQEDNAGK